MPGRSAERKRESSAKNTAVSHGKRHARLARMRAMFSHVCSGRYSSVESYCKIGFGRDHENIRGAGVASHSARYLDVYSFVYDCAYKSHWEIELNKPDLLTKTTKARLI